MVVTWLLDPLDYEFVRNALAVGILSSVLCAVVGSYAFVQRLTLLSDVVAHAVLPGLALSWFWGVDVLVGALASGICSTLVIAGIRAQSRIKADAAMAIAFSGFFSLGILLVSVLDSKIDLEDILFGDILGATITDIRRTAIIALLVFGAIALCYKELLFYTFDRTGAEAAGLPTQWIHLGFMTALTLTIIASLQAVGVVLVISLLVGPCAAAYLLVKELHWMMSLGAVLGTLTTIAGIYLSYYANLPSGAAIALLNFGTFFLILLLHRMVEMIGQTRRSR